MPFVYIKKVMMKKKVKKKKIRPTCPNFLLTTFFQPNGIDALPLGALT